jgi:hypothetical protein
MKHIVVSLFLILTYSLSAQKSPLIDGLEFSWINQHGYFKPKPYTDYYSSFYYPKELVHPDSLLYPAASKGYVDKALIGFSFYKDSILLKPDTLRHRFDRLKIGLGAGRSKISYYQLTTRPDSAQEDSTYNYKVFDDLFRVSAEYQIYYRTHKKLQFYTGLGLYSDLKVASILAKDGRRFNVNDSQIKVVVKKYMDLGLSVPLGLRFRLARNTYFHYEFRLGSEFFIDHTKQVKFLITRGFNFNISVALK